ncbi:hypothetical protein ACOME3_001242 [Neoechinorhynchus agilis]
MPPKRNRAMKRSQRATSNVFSMFDQAQIQEFKEAFNIIDGDHDGFITIDDLKEIFASLGKVMPEEDIAKMVDEAPNDINFTMFLTLFGEKLMGTDPEEVIANAFACFDSNSTGYVDANELREFLITLGDRYTEEEADDLLREAPIKDGKIDYREFTKILKHGRRDED